MLRIVQSATDHNTCIIIGHSGYGYKLHMSSTGERKRLWWSLNEGVWSFWVQVLLILLVFASICNFFWNSTA